MNTQESAGSRLGSDVKVTRWKGHTRYRWRASYVEGGKRRQKGFKTNDAAQEWADNRRKVTSKFGTDTALTVSERSTVIESRQDLSALNLSLSDAVKFAIDYHRKKALSLTVSELVEKTLANITSKGLSLEHYKNTKRHLERFAKDFGNEPATTIEADTITDWLDELELEFSGRTINHHRAAIRKMFNLIGGKHPNPVVDVPSKKVMGSEIGILSPAEISKLLGVAYEDILPAFAIGAFAGVRDSEIKRLDWSEIDFEAESILITARNAKTSSQRRIPISSNLRKWLEPLAKVSGPVWPENGRALHDETKLKAGFGNPDTAPKGVTLKPWPHNALRHSYASYHLAKQKKADELALNLGHENTVMIFKHYRRVVSVRAAKSYWSITPDTPSNVVAIAC